MATTLRRDRLPVRNPPDFSLRTKLGAVVAVAVLVLLVGMLGTLAVREYRTSGAVASDTRDLQRTLGRVLQRLTDAETGQRGYLLTGAEVFLEPYHGATADVDGALERLRRLSVGSPHQVSQLDTLTHLVARRVDSLERSVNARRAGSATSVEQLQHGRAMMDSVRGIAARMDADIDARLVTQSARADREGNIAIGVMLIGSTVAFLLLLLINAAITRDVRLREAALTRIEEQNAELEVQAAALSEQQIEVEHQLEEAQVMTEELALANDEYHALSGVAEQARTAAELALEQFRASDMRYRFLADTIPVQVWTAAPDGQLDFVSQDVAEYFGRSREDILGEGWLGVLHPSDVDNVVQKWTQSLATGEQYDVNFRLRRADGAYRWHLGRAIALRDEHGRITAWFGSNIDINDEYRVREEREHLVGALKRTNQELDQFAYVASHDLKAPLRGIANLSQWIEEDIGDAFPADARHKMELLRGRVHRLEGLIDGILEYSRAGRSRVAATSIDVAALVREVVELLDPPESMQVRIDDPLPSVVAEQVPLSQIFSNLIGNAIKYSGRSDTIITVGAADAGAMVRFSVTDNGPGIPPQYHDRIFVVFQTLAPRDKVEGTGLGLAVVKKIVEARGGHVWVQSPPADATTGTTFHFTWPRMPGKEA
jgi:PAS domain S-box-containing protein